MTKNELFELFDKYDTYTFNEKGESIHSIKWADLNGLADELVKLFVIPDVSNQRELLIAFCDWAELEEQKDLNNDGLVIEWMNKSNL